VGTSALAITDDHRDLADSASGQLRRLDSRSLARATLDDGSKHPERLWQAAADLGWQGLALSEQFGGSGVTLAELAVVLEVQRILGLPRDPLIK
jgi:alkylation response protein AidB-like acyl-CoA dehydrogenase